MKSFDVKDCYVHVKTLGTRLNELNEEIIQYLILNAGSKQQAKLVQLIFSSGFNLFVFLNRGKKKLALVAKETKEQLASLQSKLELANTGIFYQNKRIVFQLFVFLEMINRDNKIEKLEKEIETIHNQTKINEVRIIINKYFHLIV